jgi:hypothetical protein
MLPDTIIPVKKNPNPCAETLCTTSAAPNSRFCNDCRLAHQSGDPGFRRMQLLAAALQADLLGLGDVVVGRWPCEEAQP